MTSELRNRFVGPRSIESGDAFYGRNTEVAELYHLLRARRIVLLHSPSGAGKSSLVQAGLVPKLKEGRFDVWRPIRVNFDPTGLDLPTGTNRYGLSALVSLEGERPPERQRPPAVLAKMDLATYIDTRPRRTEFKGRPVVLIFDQFEEVLTTAPRALDEKRAFFSALGHALDGRDHLALFIIREDYLGAFAPYRDRVPTQLSNTFRLDLLGLDGAREAAVETAREGGREFPAAAELVDLLARTRVQRPDGTEVEERGIYVEPVQLQVVCRRLWEAMPAEDRSIESEDIRAFADVNSALASYYADTVKRAAQGEPSPGKAHRMMRDWVGEKLIVGGIRTPVRMGKEQSGGLDNRLILRLVDSYLVRSEVRAGATWFELSHDRLVEPVIADNAAWQERHLHPMQVQARLWRDGNRTDALLLGAEALSTAAIWALANPERVTEVERAFLARSAEVRGEEARRKEEEQRQRRRERRFLWVIGAALLLAVGLAAAALVSYQNANKAAELLGKERDVAEAAKVDAEEQKGAAEMATERAEKDRYKARRESEVADLATVEAKEQTQIANNALIDARNQRAIAEASGAEAVASRDEAERQATAAEHQSQLARAQTRIAVARGTSSVWERIALLREQADDGTVPRGWDLTAREALASPVELARWTAPPGQQIIGFDACQQGGAARRERNLVRCADPGGGSGLARVVTASKDGVVRVWDAHTGKVLASLEGHEDQVSKAVFSPDGSRVVTASWDGTARVWNVGTATLIRKLEGHMDAVSGALFSPDGSRVVTVSEDGTARLWDAATGEVQETLKADGYAVRSVGFSPDGASVVTTSDDRKARVWNADTGKVLATLKGHESNVVGADFHGDGRYMVTASLDGTARLWDAATGEVQETLKADDNPVVGVAFSPEGIHVLTASSDGTARVWYAEKKEVLATLKGNEGKFMGATFTPDGSRVVIASQDAIRLWDAAPGHILATLKPHKGEVYGAALSADGEQVVTAHLNVTALTWDYFATSRLLATLDGHQDAILDAAFSPDGSRVVIPSDDKAARVWEAATGKVSATLRGHINVVNRAAFSPDSARVVTTSWDHTARLWEATGELLRTLEGHESKVNGAAFSHDGARVATASDDGTVRVWDATTGAVLKTLGEAYGTDVFGVAFSPDGARVVSTSSAAATVWDLATGRVLATLEASKNTLDHPNFSPDGARVVTTSSDGGARVWDAATGKLLVSLGFQDDPVIGASFSPDGARVVTVSSDGTARIWPISVALVREALWRRTSLCLSADQRQDLLGESSQDALARRQTCLDTVARYAAKGAYPLLVSPPDETAPAEP